MDLRHGASYCISSIMPIARRLTRTFIAQQSASSGPRVAARRWFSCDGIQQESAGLPDPHQTALAATL